MAILNLWLDKIQKMEVPSEEASLRLKRYIFAVVIRIFFRQI